jgi:hypothetical protein
MKKTLTVACLTAALAATLAAPAAAAVKLSIRLNGGAAWLLDGAGDLERFRKGENALADDWAGDDFRTASFSWKKLSTIPELSGELIIHLGPRLGIGIGVGYLEARAKADYATAYSQSWSLAWGNFLETEDYAIKRDLRASAIPVTLSLHYATPLSSRLNLTAQAGIGYYFGRLKHVCDVTDAYFYGYESEDFFDQKAYYDETARTADEATCNTLGFQGGLGLEMLLGRSLSLGFELYGRFVNFSGFKGDSAYEATSRERFWHETLGWWFDETSTTASGETGDLYYWDWHSDYYGRDYAALGVRATAPAGAGILSVRKAEVNLNRIGLLVTLRFRFDL